jgi:hypothetical protein
MKSFPSQSSARAGSALLLTMLITGVALVILAGAMAWAASNAKLTERSNRYTSSVAAAEAATEKVLSQISRDFLLGGEKLVNDNVAGYIQSTPTTTDSGYWSDWEFNDAGGNIGQTFVQASSPSAYSDLGSVYAGLRGFITTYTVVSNARQPAAPEVVVGAVLQQLQLARIPIFQFAMYSSGDMEISCGQPFTISGRVHSNKQLYVEPASALTFQSHVTASGDILFARDPLDTRTPTVPSGSVLYQLPGEPVPHQPVMYLPIGMTNTPTAIREIIQPPPLGEDPNSPIGRERYYNLADMIVAVSDTGISATSGEFNSFMTAVPSNQVTLFINTTNSFWDEREGKTILPIDIDVGSLRSWSLTNSSLRVALGSKDLASLYVVDHRTSSATTLGAVRVRNGVQLPSRGLTVATARPLYVFGNYNQTNAANLGTTNTAGSLPASLVGDALTILSVNWNDANATSSSSTSYGLRIAKPTTVNAAILAGAVETVQGAYGGGMENFPRFLEQWGQANTITYNGSMVKMFPSQYATNMWGKANVYNPPKRNWAYDINFDDPLKLPPVTPSLQSVTRGLWTTLPPNQTTVPASP